MLRRLYKLDNLYGLLLTFGIALVMEGFFRHRYGVSGLPYSIPDTFAGAFNLGFMFLPKYRAWVIVASLLTCFATWFVIERTPMGAYLRAATENPKLVQAFGINVPVMITLDVRNRCRPGGTGGSAGCSRNPNQPADGIEPDHCRLRGRGHRRHGIDSGVHCHGIGTGAHRGADQSLLFASRQYGRVPDHGRWFCWSGRRDFSARKGESLNARFLGYALLLAMGLIAPFVVYPDFPDARPLLRAVCLRLQSPARLRRIAFLRPCCVLWRGGLHHGIRGQDDGTRPALPASSWAPRPRCSWDRFSECWSYAGKGFTLP